MRELDSLKNFCSVNYSLKSLIYFAQVHNVSNIDINDKLGDFACPYRSNEAFL